MADESKREIPFKILVETPTAEKSVGELKQEFRDLTKVIEETKVGTDEYNRATNRLAAVKEVLQGVAGDTTQIANANKTLLTGLPALNKEYKDLQRSIQSGKLSADELQKALFRAGEVRGQIRDLNSAVNALDPERRFQAFAKIGSTIASGFAAAQAATALFGQENEDLIKVLVKVQAATALAQGLQGLQGFTKALREAGLALKAFALSNPFTAIAAAVVALTVIIYKLTEAIRAQGSELSKVTKEHEKREKAIKNEILAIENKIIALKNLKGAEEEVLKLDKAKIEADIRRTQSSLLVAQATLKEVNANDSLFETLIKLTQGEVVYAQLKAKNRGDALSNIKQLQDDLNKLNAQLEASNNEIVNSVTERNKKLAEQNSALAQQELDNQIASLEGIESAEGKVIELKKQKIQLQLQETNANILFQQQERNRAETSFSLTREERNAKIRAAEDEIAAEKLKQAELTGQLISASAERRELTQKEITERQAQQKALKESLLKDELQFITDEETLAIIHAQKTITDQKTLDAEVFRIQNETDKKRIELLSAAGESTLAVQKDIADRLIKQVDEALKEAEDKASQIVAKQFAETPQEESPLEIENAEFEERKNNLQLFYDEQGNLTAASQRALEKLTQDHEKKVTAIILKEAEDRKKSEDQLRSLRLLAAKTGFDIFGQLATAFAGKSDAAARRAFNINKAFAIASATVDTYSAATAAYKSQFIPIPDPSSPVRGTIAAGIAVAQGLAKIAIIANTQFNSSASSAPSGGGGGAPSFSGGEGGGFSFAPPQIAPPQIGGAPVERDEDGNFVGFTNQPQQPQNLHLDVTAIVVESEMTKKQKIVKSIEDRSKY